MNPSTTSLLEASGVADPSSIYMTFVDSSYRDMIRLDSVTCVVDAEQAFRSEDPRMLETQLTQIGFSDLLILNKVDLAGVDGTVRTKRIIDHNFNRVRVIPAVKCNVPLDVLLSVGRFDEQVALGAVAALTQKPEKTDEHDHKHDHTHRSMFSTWSFRTAEPLSRRNLNDMIKRLLPANIYRCKGIVYLADDPIRRYVLQVVGRRVELKPDRDWDGEEAGSQIVAISQRTSLDEVALTELFEGCVESQPQTVKA